MKTLHEITRKSEYFDFLMHGLHYEFSWKFAYNTRHINEPLKSLKWASCGGSITSSHNIHIHPMGSLIAEEIYYAYLISNDKYIASRLKDTLNWALGSYNDGDPRWGFGAPGHTTEQFFFTDGCQDTLDEGVGEIWKDHLSWAASCILFSCVADIPDEYYRH